MANVNLASTPSRPEDEDPDTTIDLPEDPPRGGGGKATRILVILLAVVVMAAGGYFAWDYFMAPKLQPPARPVRPLAKAPVAPPGAPGAPAVPAAPGAPPVTLPGGPTKGEGPAKAEAPGAAPGLPATPGTSAPAGPPGKAAATSAAKAEAKGPAPAKVDLTKVAKAPAAPPAAAPLPSAPSRAPRAEGPPGAYGLQMGAMVNEANAQKLKQRLEQLGYSPSIRKGVANVRRHVVIVGDFADRAGAEDLMKRLAGQGVRGRVMSQGGRFALEAGTFANEDDAIDLARELQKLTYLPRIQDVQQNTTIYQVRVGSYASREEARAKGAELQGKGFRYFVVKN